MDTPLRTRLQLTAILAAAVLILTAAVPPLSLGWVNDTRAQRQIDETQVRALRETQSLLVDAETGQRGFVITGTDAFLDVYRQATTQLPGTLDRLSVAYSGAPAQERALVDGIVHAARAKMDELARTVALRRSQGFAAVEPIVGSGEGKRYMDEVRQGVDLLTRREDVEVIELEDRLRSKIATGIALSVGSAALTLFMLLVLGRAMVLTMRDNEVEARRATAAGEQAQAGLVALKQLNKEVSTLGEMSRVLQTEMSLAEALEVTSHFCARLMPATAGSIYLFRNSADLLEHVASWGEQPAPVSIEPADCWGLRRGQLHVCHDIHDLRCRHEVNTAASGTRLCLPLTAYGEVLGLLTVWQDDATSREGVDALAVMARQIAEQVALSLSNAKLRQVLRDQSIKDPLTGLFNRRYMEETITRELARAQRKSLPLAIIVADLDHFKKLNDQHGHPAGDAMLKAAAAQMQRAVRASDVACRFGGEEFVLILPECTRECAVAKAQDLCERLRRLVIHAEGKELSVTGSFGVASFPVDGNAGPELIEAADQALYRAKHAGRDRVCAVGDLAPPTI